MTSPNPGSQSPLQAIISPDQARLLALMLDPNRPPEIRAEAGRQINQFGDPRPGVVDFNFGTDYWCKVPTGKFIYQDDSNASIDYDYWIGKYPVTYAQYKTFIDDPNGYRNPQWWQGLNPQGLEWGQKGPGIQKWPIANHPAENVSWYDAMAFCAWLNATLTFDQSLKSQGYSFRLPTEREWEKSARSTDGRKFPYRGRFVATKSNTSETGINQTSAVGMFPDGASPYGILDLCGNVMDWTLTEYRTMNSRNIDNVEARVLRGGSWNSPERYSRTAFRNSYLPAFRHSVIGFRIVCSVPVQ